MTLKCNVCGFDIDAFDPDCGYFEDAGKIYCEKCYANKRFDEIEDKTAWLASVKAQLALFDDTPDLDLIKDKLLMAAKKHLVAVWMRKVPNVWESEFRDRKYVKSVRDLWAKKGWNV